MKLVINIPCYNEEKTLPLVLAELPRKVKGFKTVEWQIVDDGSSDRTAQIAKEFDCFVIKHKVNRGLGNAFKTGVTAALERGCDVFVNTDADNQYPSQYIPALTQPVLEGKADMVIGDRRPWKVRHFSPLKRFFQYFGNMLIRNIVGSDVPDTVSGFRAYSKEALLKLNIVTQFSYVLDTIVQAHHKGLKIMSMRIHTNGPTRKSRLFTNMYQHMRKSGANIIRLYYLYEPFRTFALLAGIAAVPGVILFLRYFVFLLFFNNGSGHIQSLVISAILLLGSILLFGFGIVADSLKTNRMIIEEQYYHKKRELYD